MDIAHGLIGLSEHLNLGDINSVKNGIEQQKWISAVEMDLCIEEDEAHGAKLMFMKQL